MAQQLRLFTTPALKKQQEHIHTENTTARRLLSEELKDMVEQRQWVGQGQKWGREGGNKKKKILQKRNKLTTEDGYIHHWLKTLSGRDKTIDQNELVISICVKCDGYAFLCFIFF